MSNFMLEINQDPMNIPSKPITEDEAKERIISAIDNNDIPFLWRTVAFLLKEDLVINRNDKEIFNSFMIAAQDTDINNKEDVDTFMGSFMVVNLKLSEQVYIVTLAKEYTNLHNNMIKKN